MKGILPRKNITIGLTLAVFPYSFYYFVAEYPALESALFAGGGSCDLACGIMMLYLWLAVTAFGGMFLAFSPLKLFHKVTFGMISVMLAAPAYFLARKSLDFDDPELAFVFVASVMAYISGFVVGQVLYLLLAKYFSGYLRCANALRWIWRGLFAVMFAISLTSLLWFSVTLFRTHTSIEEALARCYRLRSQACYVSTAYWFGEEYSAEVCLKTLGVREYDDIKIWHLGDGTQETVYGGTAPPGKCLIATAVVRNDIHLCDVYEKLYRYDFGLGDCQNAVRSYTKNP